MQDKLAEWFEEDLGKGDFTSLAVVSNEICSAAITGGPVLSRAYIFAKYF